MLETDYENDLDFILKEERNWDKESVEKYKTKIYDNFKEVKKQSNKELYKNEEYSGKEPFFLKSIEMQEECNDNTEEHILPNNYKKNNYTSSDSKVKPLKTLVLIYLEKKNQDLEREKDKERFYKNKCLIEELADRARIQREKWYLAKYKSKEKNKNLNVELRTADIAELNTLDNIKNHKKLKLDCSFLHNENARLKAEIERLKHRNEKYRKKVYKVRGEKIERTEN